MTTTRKIYRDVVGKADGVIDENGHTEHEPLAWSSPVQVGEPEEILEAGRTLKLTDFRWHGETSVGDVLRWGFRSPAKIPQSSLRVEFSGDDGRRVAPVEPSVFVSEDADGLFAVAAEVRTPAGAVSALLKGTSSNPDHLLVGPLGVERFAKSPQGPMLGAPVQLQLREGTGSFRLRALVVSGLTSTPVHYALQFLDKYGAQVLPSADSSVSPTIGSYVVLEQVPSTDWAQALISVPEEASAVAVRPFKSRPETAVVCSLQATARDRAADSLDDFLDELNPDAALVFIDSTAPPLGSGLITIRPNNMAIQYSSLGIAVVSVGYGELQGIDRRPRNLVYQAPRKEFGSVIERLAIEGVKRRCLYVCSSFPSPSAVVAMDRLKRTGWTTLYEIRDDMEEFKRVGYSQWYTAEGESLICRRADHITAVSPALARKAETLALRQRNAVVIPNGIQPHFIAKAARLRSLDSVEAKRRQGIVGYVGHLTDAWFDWDYVLRAAEALPENTFEIIGPGKPDTLRLPNNVRYLGPQPQDRLQSLTQTWAVGLVPFKKSPLTRAVDPNKLFEYVAWGMRTVAAEMGSIDECPTATAYHTFEEMVTAITDALERPWTQHELDSAEVFLRGSTWRRRAVQTLEVVGL